MRIISYLLLLVDAVLVNENLLLREGVALLRVAFR